MTKRILAIAAAAAAVFLSACATDPAVEKARADAMVMAGNVRVAEATAAAEEARAVQALAAKVDAGGASAYLVAKALKGLGAPQAPQVVQVQQPQSLFGLAWQSLLQVADIALRGYGIKAGRDVGIVQSNNQAATSIASYGAFTTMGGHIATAGVAGYPYVQAPAPNITNTLSGTGVLGSGSYVGPVTTTTTRNCAGGQGAAGGAGGTGTDTGGAGAAGGSGQGGSC